MLKTDSRSLALLPGIAQLVRIIKKSGEVFAMTPDEIILDDGVYH